MDQNRNGKRRGRGRSAASSSASLAGTIKEAAASVSPTSTSSVYTLAQARGPPDPGWMGLEEWRRQLGLSKSAFYGPGGPARAVQTVQISPKRQIVSEAERRRVYRERAREPAIQEEM